MLSKKNFYYVFEVLKELQFANQAECPKCRRVSYAEPPTHEPTCTVGIAIKVMEDALEEIRRQDESGPEQQIYELFGNLERQVSHVRNVTKAYIASKQPKK